MTNETITECLVVDGDRQGEVWLKVEAGIGSNFEFYERDGKRRIEEPHRKEYLGTKILLDDKEYFVCSEGDLSGIDVISKIKSVSPPLKPIN